MKIVSERSPKLMLFIVTVLLLCLNEQVSALDYQDVLYAKAFSKEELAKLEGPAVGADATKEEKIAIKGTPYLARGTKVIVERSKDPKYTWGVVLISRGLECVVQLDEAGRLTKAVKQVKIIPKGKPEGKPSVSSWTNAHEKVENLLEFPTAQSIEEAAKIISSQKLDLKVRNKEGKTLPDVVQKANSSFMLYGSYPEQWKMLSDSVRVLNPQEMAG